jgi:hypothetical protein
MVLLAEVCMKVGVFVIFALSTLFLCHVIAGGLDDDEFKEFTRDAKKSLKKDPYAAVHAVKKLGEDNSERAAKFVFGLATSSKTPPKVYRQCLETLSSFTSKSPAGYIAKQAQGSKTSHKIVAAQVLAKLPGEKALEALVKLTEDKNEVIARLAAKSLGERGDTKAVEPLIELLERTQKQHGLAWQAALDALRRLTGSDDSGPWIASDWRDFWAAKKREEQWQKTNKKSDLGGPHTELPEFFGAKIVSRKVIFVMDISYSMTESDSGGQRLARMKQELCSTIEKLDKDASFNVLGFNTKLFPWKTRLQPANDSNKNSAIAFVKKMKAAGLTYTDDALKAALTDKNANAIFLLSDGVPLRKEHQGTMSEAFLEKVLDWVSFTNRFRRVVIHTFGFDAIAKETGGDRCVNFLTKLAEYNEGKYHNIR